MGQPAGEVWNESTKMGRRGSVGGRKPVSAWQWGAGVLRRPEAAAQQSRKGGQLGGKAREDGVEKGSRRTNGRDDHENGGVAYFLPGPQDGGRS